MTDSSHFPGAPVDAGTTCLGRTCLKWSADGELSALDLGLVLERLAQVDAELTGLPQDSVQPCPSIS
jgi:hypothetical protein